ncbi:glycosyltransferase [Flavobacterium sp.]|uniref:glycosyltransferase n=1 Tax=Flavobacterium sp. TaxID=239 RepID=UPI00262487B5|nr:glycosyltransferase [Flavobacterium sp.]
MKRKKLVVISHTEHYMDTDGLVKGWGSTINEINFLADYWEEVYHVGCLYTTLPPASSLPYTQKNIQFVPIPPYGGKRFLDKILILFKTPKIIFQVIKTIRGASEVQLRLPTSMGLFLLPLFSFFLFRKFTFWVKYAGNWSQTNAPVSYRIQRWWLQKNWANCKVTINGFWDNQPTHCFSFENPSLTLDDIDKGKSLAKLKEFQAPFVFCFVGRLDAAKGMNRIIDTLKNIPEEKIAKIHFIGDGPEMEYYKKETEFLGEKVIYHGFLDKTNVHRLLAESHFLLLPSNSEGFPKVVAEGACYGVVPIVSNVGSIGHYITEKNGFLWDINSSISYDVIMNQAVFSNATELKDMSNNVMQLAEKFTFTNYISKLEMVVLQ